jgi:hypothetical protein
VDCLQLYLLPFSLTKLSLIIYIRKYLDGLPFRHSARDGTIDTPNKIVLSTARAVGLVASWGQDTIVNQCLGPLPLSVGSMSNGMRFRWALNAVV